MTKLKITMVSDLHGEKPRLPGGDLLILAGDYTTNDTPWQWTLFYDWLKVQPYRKIIYIGGNHDNYLSNCITTKELYDLPKDVDLDNMKPTHIEYLCNSGCEFEGLKIWGSPNSLWFPGVHPSCKAFMESEKQLAEIYSKIPDDIDILITHGPSHGVLDGLKNRDGTFRHVGSYSLLNQLDRIQPSLHIFGHIHEHGGHCMVYKQWGGQDTRCYNVSYINENYDPREEDPLTIDYVYGKRCASQLLR